MEKDKETQPAYAARLVDPTHRVEIGLYPLPQNEAELQVVLNHLRAMPHTREERDAVLSQLKASASFLSAEALAQQFPEVATAEAAEPVQIELSAENYGLLYSAVQYAPGSRGPVVPFPAESAETPEPEAEAESEGTEAHVEESAEETPGATTTEAGADETPAEEENPLLARLAAMQAQLEALKEEALRPAPEPEVNTEAAADTARLTELQQQVESANQAAKQALAASVALHMKMLRKPAARDKSQEALAAELVEKSTEVLQDRLQTLMEELAAGTIPAAAELETLEDPTRQKEVPAEEKAAPDLQPSLNPAELQGQIEVEETGSIQIESDRDILSFLFAEMEEE